MRLGRLVEIGGGCVRRCLENKRDKGQRNKGEWAKVPKQTSLLFPCSSVWPLNNIMPPLTCVRFPLLRKRGTDGVLFCRCPEH